MEIDSQGNFGMVFDIDHYAVHDGPGIRTCIFLKGCFLSCVWCHSPESQSIDPQLLFSSSRCTLCGACTTVCPKALHSMDTDGHKFSKEGCTTCGRCAEVCPSGALFVCGQSKTVDEVVNEALEDRVFYKNSGGGVTLTGGEVLYQPAFTRRILQALKKEGVHTIVETSGFGSKQDLIDLVPFTDVFYYDFKLGEKELFKKYTGGDLNVVLENLVALRKRTDSIVLRVPLIPGITDSIENITSAYEIANKLKIGLVHLLPYNSSADAKYDWCGKIYPLGKLNARSGLYEELLNLAPKDIKVSVVT
ncbi:MAG TPA: glycyl-radical enzyme activating protein [Ruminiclostridium sp.]